MRSFDPNDKDDQEDAKKHRALPWMLECLQMNPDYCHWGPVLVGVQVRATQDA